MSQTIRSIGGAQAARGIDPRSTALVLIDFQNEYFTGRLPLPEGEALVRFADRHGIAVFHVQHVNGAASPLFAEGSAAAAIHSALAPQAWHRVLRKSTVSTFASTDLDAQLRALGVKTLIVAGLMTHMCVSTMVRDARQFGGSRNYDVLLAADACATRDIDGWDGGVVSHWVLHGATLTALSDNFAEVLPTAAILDLPVGE